MNFKAFNEIIQLNKDFYAKIGEDFSKTRQSPWNGWSKALDSVRESVDLVENIKIADLGCGNGRFLKFLLENNLKNFVYYGYDSDSYLLDSPSIDYDAAEVHFKKSDVIIELNSISETFDMVVAFGLVHHIPSSEFRLKWFQQVVSKLNSGGIFIFTTWNYDRDTRFDPNNNGLPYLKDDLEDGDYFIGWNNLSNIYRYVHIYSENEIKNILESLEATLIDKFSADGKNGNLNDYYILKKR